MNRPVPRFSFEVPGKPVPQGSMRAYGGRLVHNNHADLMPWRAAVAGHAATKKPDNWDKDGAMHLYALFLLPRPQAHRNKHGVRPTAPRWHTTKPDLDKLARALCDALTTAGIWWDDNQLGELHAVKRYDDTGPGHLYCTVEHLTEKGT